jgi:hypothetical protein
MLGRDGAQSTVDVCGEAGVLLADDDLDAVDRAQRGDCSVPEPSSQTTIDTIPRRVVRLMLFTSARTWSASR